MCHNTTTLLESVAVSASCIRICGCHGEPQNAQGDQLPAHRTRTRCWNQTEIKTTWVVAIIRMPTRSVSPSDYAGGWWGEFRERRAGSKDEHLLISAATKQEGLWVGISRNCLTGHIMTAVWQWSIGETPTFYPFQWLLLRFTMTAGLFAFKATLELGRGGWEESRVRSATKLKVFYHDWVFFLNKHSSNCYKHLVKS